MLPCPIPVTGRTEARVAGFRTHITTSTVLGAAYGAYGYVLGVPLTTCAVSWGLCSVAGMLPDLDSDSGVPLREAVCFGSAVIPMLMMDRFVHMGLTHEDMVVAAGVVYVLLRFVVAELFRRYTVHRGMWHSLPAAAICGLATYLVCSCEERLRLFKSGAVVLGFMSHLVLDEIWSVQLSARRGVRLKKSFGTAIKLWGPSTWANLSAYGKLGALVLLVTHGEQKFIDYFEQQEHKFHYAARQVLDHVLPHAAPSTPGGELPSEGATGWPSNGVPLAAPSDAPGGWNSLVAPPYSPPGQLPPIYAPGYTQPAEYPPTPAYDPRYGAQSGAPVYSPPNTGSPLRR